MDNMKILVINPYRGIGDLIFHLPLFRGLYEKYKSRIILITNESNKAKFILKNEFSISKIIYLKFTRENLINNSINLLNKINSYKSDICVVTAYSKRLSIPLYLSNSKNKKIFRKSSNINLSEYILEQSNMQFPNINFLKNYKINFSNKHYTKNIFVSLDSFHDQNNWDQNNFIELINKLINKKFFIYINFSPNKINTFRKTINLFRKKRKILFTYSKKFHEIIKYISNSKYVIGNESGPICLGASLNKIIFSIYDPVYTPKLSSKIINNKINYLNSKILNKDKIINLIIDKLN